MLEGPFYVGSNQKRKKAGYILSTVLLKNVNECISKERDDMEKRGSCTLRSMNSSNANRKKCDKAEISLCLKLEFGFKSWWGKPI